MTDPNYVARFREAVMQPAHRSHRVITPFVKTAISVPIEIFEPETVPKLSVSVLIFDGTTAI